MSRLDDIEKSIKKYTNEAVMGKVYNEKLRKNVLIVLLYGGSGLKVRVYDETRGLDEIGAMSYSIIGKRMSISSFVVKEDFQRNGIGRLMFEFATAHADFQNVDYLHGVIDPTDPIKGVSSEENFDIEPERNALIKIYKKLGCDVASVNVGGEQKLIFDQTWKHGEKFNSVDAQRRKMIEEVVKQQNKKIEK